MYTSNRARAVRAVILWGILVGIFPATGFSKSLLYALNNEIPVLHVMDPVTGDEISTVGLSVDNEAIVTGNGLAVSPVTNEMYAAVKLDSQQGPGRNLIRIDPYTGTAVNIGNMGQPIASLAFDADGVLYAVSGDCNFGCGGQATPETLFTVDTDNANLTFFLTLGNGNDGEAIAFNPVDGMMYHMSGWGGDLIFEKINLDTLAITPIALSGDDVGVFESQGFAFDESQNLFVGSLIDCLCTPDDNSFFKLTADGVLSHVNSLPGWLKDYAFHKDEGPNVLLDLEALPNVADSGAVDAAILVDNTVYVWDGSTGNPISQFTVLNNAWQRLDMAVSADGSNSLVGVLVQSGGGVIKVAVYRADDGSLVDKIGYFNSAWQPYRVVYVEDADGPGQSAFAVIAKNINNNRVSAQLRRISDGSLIRTITYFRNTWTPVDAAAMADISGNSRPEFVVLARSDAGSIQGVARDASSGALINKVRFFGKTTMPKGIAVLGSIGATAADELSVLGELANGRNKIQNRDSLDDTKLGNVSFANADWEGKDLASLTDVNGNSSADLSALLQHDMTNEIRGEVRDGATGAVIKKVKFLSSTWHARAMVAFADIDGNGIQELGVVAIQNDGDVRLQLRDALTATVIVKIDIP